MSENNTSTPRYLQWGYLIIIPILTVLLSSGVNYYQNKKRDDFEKFKFAQQIMENKDLPDEQKEWALKQMAIYFADSDLDMGNNLKYTQYYAAIVNSLKGGDFKYCFKPSQEFFDNNDKIFKNHLESLNLKTDYTTLSKDELIVALHKNEDRERKLFSGFMRATYGIIANCDGLQQSVEKEIQANK
ncbi:hypothetical protein QBD01_001183 [Ochrobactrum sp. 19YEA23]|uniref:hypothetical protein n=1 Tax=Ochrobactrum sp. 19YEA23 TaxID=3039854 RepID=UPI0024793651|nr:hypothetical protein [Ochrobactrum sp. 19YEA23]